MKFEELTGKRVKRWWTLAEKSGRVWVGGPRTRSAQAQGLPPPGLRSSYSWPPAPPRALASSGPPRWGPPRSGLPGSQPAPPTIQGSPKMLGRQGHPIAETHWEPRTDRGFHWNLKSRPHRRPSPGWGWCGCFRWAALIGHKAPGARPHAHAPSSFSQGPAAGE